MTHPFAIFPGRPSSTRFVGIACAAVLSLSLASPAQAGHNDVSIRLISEDPSTGGVQQHLDAVDLTSGSYSPGVADSGLGNPATGTLTLSQDGPLVRAAGSARSASYSNPDSLLKTIGSESYVRVDQSYSVNVIGPDGGGAVPLLFSGATKASLSKTLVSNIDAVAALSLQQMQGATSLVSLRDAPTSITHYSYPEGETWTAAWNYSSPPNAGTGVFDSSSSFIFAASVNANTTLLVDQSVRLDIYGPDSYFTSSDGIVSADVSLDPVVTIDPVWAAAHPGYSIKVEAGYGNGPVEAVPEPGTTMLVAGGLMLLAGLKRRRGRRPGASFPRRD